MRKLTLETKKHSHLTDTTLTYLEGRSTLDVSNLCPKLRATENNNNNNNN